MMHARNAVPSLCMEKFLYMTGVYKNYHANTHNGNSDMDDK